MMNVVSQTSQPPSRELISFHLGGQDFCIDIMAVREIRGWTPATFLPHAPDYVRGVINLRGAVLPIVDLGSQLGLGPSEPTKQHVIIVVQVGSQTIGLLVDAVNDILTVTEAMIQPTPEVASGLSRSHVEGLITLDGRMLGLLQLDRIIPASQAAEGQLQAA